MTLENLLNCSRPLYLETDIEGVDYGQVGSCFLVRRGNLLWVATARHCLWLDQQPKVEEVSAVVERLWIPQALADVRPMSFGFMRVRVGSSATCAAAADIAVIDVANEPLPETVDFCDLASFPLCTPEPGDKLSIAGYPKLINEIQYPEKEGGKLKPRRLLTSGSFVGKGTAPGLIAMLLDEPDTVASCDGMARKAGGYAQLL